MQNKKHKILFISDHPLSTSGVGTQSRYLISGLVNTGKYSVYSLGAAIKHESYEQVNVTPDFVVKPIDGFGNRELLRLTLAQEQPDAMVLFTDPRFFLTHFEMADEIRQVCPIAYWTIWDNGPWPDFNRVLYDSCDLLNCINYNTYDMIKQNCDYRADSVNWVPHAVPGDLFFPMKKEDRLQHKRNLIKRRDDTFVALWVNRNARRKMPGDVLHSWKLFIEQLEKKHGHRNAALIMHTDPLDNEGPNLHHIVDLFKLNDTVIFSKERCDFPQMNIIYNISDCVISRSCFTGDQLVITDKGYREIKDVEIGEKVLTDKGRYMPVVKKSKRPVEKDEGLYTIKLTNNDPIKVTGEHPFVAISKSKVDFLINENIDKLENLIEWKNVSDLQVGDYLVYKNQVLEERVDQKIDMFKFVEGETALRGKGKENMFPVPAYTADETTVYYNMSRMVGKPACPRYIDVTPELAYVMGFWVADGTTHTSHFCLNGKTERELAVTLSNKIKTVLSKTTYFNDAGNRFGVIIENAAVTSKMFDSLCGEYSEKKFVPDVILNSNDEIRRAFLEGYMAGDGCVLTNKETGRSINRCRTISHNLAYGVKTLLVKLGYCPALKYAENTGFTKNKIWTIEWNDRKRENNGSCRSWNVDGKMVVSRIFDIQFDKDAQADVYNFEVEEDHTYSTVGCTVHNCAEGFGLGLLEGAMAGVPAVALKTGGMEYQVTDYRDGSENGVAVDVTLRNLVGSQTVPYIWDDQCTNEAFADGIMRMYDLGPDGRAARGAKSREYSQNVYGIEKMIRTWDESLEKCIENFKKNPRRWALKKI